MDLIKRISIAYNKSIHINSLDSMWIHWIKPKLEDVLNIIFDGMGNSIKLSSKLNPILNKLKLKFK